MQRFPTAGLLPKEETIADEFLKRYSEYDGRNTVVAIFDTGVDPGAIGLQKTSDGKPKIIDIIDATGSCDVDTSHVVEAQDGKIQLPHGKTLTLNPAWKKSVDGKYHVGTRAAYDLFPKPLVRRMKNERKEKFDINQREAVNTAQLQLAEWNQKNTAETSDVEQLRIKKDIQSRIDLLKKMSENYDDPGPIYDCVVFFDGEHWRAAIDVKENGDLTDVPALANYRVEHQHAKFSDESQLNYGVNIYDEGNTLSIVCDAGAHGTHVAGIVAAYHPNQPECNGVAPGAQIISVKIGDTRLGSMETCSALSRAVQAMIQAKCDIVNMSYGEYAGDHNSGRVVELIKELVDEHNVTFVCSAGNNGPALGTVGAPGGTSSCLLGIGAYVSPQMMEAEYIMRESGLPGNAFTWSSRGPTFDGDIGVNLCAPGAAIAPVPNWTLNKKQLMNGTSMSSPNCAGNIALLISGLKDKKIEYTPYSIRRALEQTAISLNGVEVFAQGKGLIQVLPAFEYLLKYKNCFDGTKQFPLHYEIKASSKHSGRGILLRDAVEFSHDSMEVNVHVSPIFHKKAEQLHKVEFERHLNLVPSARWISVGKHLVLMHEGRGFKILLHTRNLPAGEHFAEIKAYDAYNVDRGVLFSIPVTVIKPEIIRTSNPTITYDKSFCAGEIYRRFFSPPSDATWADVILSRKADESNIASESNASSKLYMLHMMQFEAHERQSTTSFKKAFYLSPGEDIVHSFDLRGGLTMELCLAQFWSTLGDSSVSVEVRFHGIHPDQQKIQINGGEGAQKVTLRSSIASEVLAPQGSFTKWVQRLRPKTAEITPLGSSRDEFPDKRQVYQLVLTYGFTKKENGKVSPHLPMLNGRLYESPFEGQMSLIFGEKKQFMGASDAYPEEISLKKGTYTIRTQLRHEDVSQLEKLKCMLLFLEHEIKDISVPVYGSPDDAALGSKSLSERGLKVDTLETVYVGEPPVDKLPDGSAAGDMLIGKVFFGKKNGTTKGAGRRPGGFPLIYSIAASSTPTKEPEIKEPKDERAEEELAKDAVRDLLLDRLTKLRGKKEFLPAWTRLDEQFPKQLRIYQAKVHHFDSENDRLNHLDEIVEAADAALGLIDLTELTLHFGQRQGSDLVPAETRKLHKDKEKEKQILEDLLSRKARALGDANKMDAFLQVYDTIQKWADVEKPQFTHVALHHDRHFQLHGLSVQRIRKVLDLDNSEREKIASDEKLQQELAKSLTELKWEHWKLYEQHWNRLRAPLSYLGF